MQSDAENKINLFTNNYVSTLGLIKDPDYKAVEFHKRIETKSFDPGLIQYVKMNNFSDTNWAVSNPNRQLLREQFQILAN